MIKITTITQGITAAAGTNSYAACIEVPTIFGATQSMPQIALTYTLGSPVIEGSAVIYPAVANIAMQYVNSQGVVTRQQQLQEHFTLGIAGTDVPATAILTGTGQVINYTSTKCCKSYGLRIDGAFTLTTTA